MTHACAACGAVREDRELLEVTHVSDSAIRYVCRPSVAAYCFGAAIRRRAEETIRLADPDEQGRRPDAAGFRGPSAVTRP